MDLRLFYFHVTIYPLTCIPTFIPRVSNKHTINVQFPQSQGQRHQNEAKDVTLVLLLLTSTKFHICKCS